MKTFEVHRKKKTNIGDAYCNPSRYFSFENLETGELENSKFDVKDNILIVGGGGLIHKKFQNHIKSLIDKQPKISVVWGIGHNFGKKYNSYYPDWLDTCDLIGIRDYIKKDIYLPCVSCMNTAFDKEYSVINDVSYYVHKAKTNFDFTQELPVMTNSETDFEKVIEFIGSSNTVVTDSYHGAYWGLLLNKDVRIVPWSVKFNHFKYQPLKVNSINEIIDKSFSPVVPQAYLDECRSLQVNFYNKFLEML